jgi:hypothetical protein
MSSIRIALAVVIAVPLLAGCVDSGRVGQEARLQTLVGGSEQDLVRRMGSPASKVTEQGGPRYMSWMHSWPGQSPGMMAMPSDRMPGDAVGAARFCETTFALDQGRVAGYSLRGDSCGWGGYPRVEPT